MFLHLERHGVREDLQIVTDAPWKGVRQSQEAWVHSGEIPLSDGEWTDHHRHEGGLMWVKRTYIGNNLRGPLVVEGVVSSSDPDEPWPRSLLVCDVDLEYAEWGRVWFPWRG
jgi:hypothetical protein